MNNKKTYLITGGAGFIGTNLVKSLIKNGNKVIVVDNLVEGDKTRLPNDAVFHEIDIRNTKDMITVCDGVDVIVHLAALPRVQFSIAEPIASHDVNINGTLSVLEAARTAKVKRVVFAASSSAYGNQETLPLSTDLQPQPLSPYALQKYFGEEMMKLWSELYGLETISLRFFNVYGPHLNPDGPYALVIGRFLQLAALGKPLTITGDGTQTRDFTHVMDVVDAIEKASSVDIVLKGTVLNVGAGEQTSVNDLAKIIGGTVEYISPRIEPKHTQADIAKTKSLLSWEPKVKLMEGISELKKEFGLI